MHFPNENLIDQMELTAKTSLIRLNRNEMGNTMSHKRVERKRLCSQLQKKKLK